MRNGILKAFGILIFTLILLIPIITGIFSEGSDLYAFGHRPGDRPGGGHGTPEPAALILLAGGIGGILSYRYLKNRKKKE